MPYDPSRHHRRSIRLPGYDYTERGAYFITMVVQHRACRFGQIRDGVMQLSECGEIVAETWRWLSDRYAYVGLGAWVVMPNHFHRILELERSAEKVKPIGELVGAFKTVSTKRVNQLRNAPGAVLWQRNYYEHVIRDECAYNTMSNYIQQNPRRWRDNQIHPRVRSRW